MSNAAAEPADALLPAGGDPDVRVAAVQTAVLTVLCGLAFLPVLRDTYTFAQWNPDCVHAFAAPVLLAILIWRRRALMASSLERGSIVGLVIVLASVGLFVASSWPFSYSMIQRLAIGPALAGVVLAVGGWRWLWRALPLLLIVALAVPTGTRYYSFLIIRPETWTLGAVRSTLDFLPGLIVELEGLDLVFEGDRSGTIALGVSFRGATLLLASLMLTVFVTFARSGAWWRAAIMLSAAVPIAIVSNYLRLLTWGLWTIYTGAEATSDTPRLVSTVVSLVCSYLLSVALLALLGGGRPTPREAGAAA